MAPAHGHRKRWRNEAARAFHGYRAGWVFPSPQFAALVHLALLASDYGLGSRAAGAGFASTHASRCAGVIARHLALSAWRADGSSARIRL